MAGLIAEGQIFDGILGATGGLLPVNGPLGKMQVDGVLLAGDAGGLSEPFCGGGVALAVMSGEYAGASISRAHESQLDGSLDEYEEAVRAALPPVPSLGLDAPEHMVDRLVCMAGWISPDARL
ncbi:MAG: hypothetical protein O3B73_16130 [bacterium]|nr:hypothetical protein [bacterium]